MVILNIACCKNTRKIGSCRFAFGDDVFVFVQVNLSFEDSCVWFMTNRDENPVNIDCRNFVSQIIYHFRSFYQEILTFNSDEFVVVFHFDVWRRHYSVHHYF
ncbi:hypothetical protein D3C72_2010540 [compost metagenome]